MITEPTLVRPDHRRPRNGSARLTSLPPPSTWSRMKSGRRRQCATAAAVPLRPAGAGAGGAIQCGRRTTFPRRHDEGSAQRLPRRLARRWPGRWPSRPSWRWATARSAAKPGSLAMSRPFGADYQPKLHLGAATGFTAAALPAIPQSTGAAVAADFDRDGDLDVLPRRLGAAWQVSAFAEECPAPQRWRHLHRRLLPQNGELGLVTLGRASADLDVPMKLAGPAARHRVGHDRLHCGERRRPRLYRSQRRPGLHAVRPVDLNRRRRLQPWTASPTTP